MTDEEFLRAFGQRVRAERARRGMSRRLLAHHAGISERYITQLESGKGNISIVLLRHVAGALGLPLTRFFEDTEVAPELRLLGQFLSRLSPAQVTEAYATLQARFVSDVSLQRNQRIALIGLRGAGKSTLGAMLAEARGVPFFELDREIERLSGSQIGVILEMYGQQAYRRYELQALREVLNEHPSFILATGGSLVSETETFELLLRHCFTVWIRATPESHMTRVIAQGDYRPMKGSEQAMDDLRRILEERTPLYARSDLAIETSGTAQEALGALMSELPVRA